VARDGTFDLPTLSVHLVEKPPLHLPSIPGFGPSPMTPWMERHCCRPDRQLVAAPWVVVFGIIGCVRDDTVPRHVLNRLANGRWEMERVLGRAPTDHAPSAQVGMGVDDPRQFRPTSAGNPSVASAPDVGATDMTGFETRSIHDSGRPRGPQAKGLGPLPQPMLHGMEVRLPHEALMSVKQDRVMRDALQAQHVAECVDECLNEHWFLSLADARQTIAAWRQDYNTCRPHSPLGYQTPEEYRNRPANTAKEGGILSPHQPPTTLVLSPNSGPLVLLC
jgi:hypothetical protein